MKANGKTYECAEICVNKMIALEKGKEFKKQGFFYRIVPVTPSLKSRFGYHKLFISKN